MVLLFLPITLTFYFSCEKRELDVTWCQDVTDAGIKALCGGATAEEEKKQQRYVGQCKSLRKFFFNKQTQITEKGVKLALQNLPYLETTDCPYIVQALAEMHQNQQQPLPKFGLTSLDLRFAITCSRSFLPAPPPSRLPYTRGSLRLVAFMCPLVTKVELTFCDKDSLITDRDLLGLLALKTLHDFTITSTHPIPGEPHISFLGGIAPILNVHGTSLESLKICIFPYHVDLASLIELCPNLRNLHLYCRFMATSQDAAPSNPKRAKTIFVLEKLEKIEIEYAQTEHLIFLLALAPAVAHLVIALIGCGDRLTDEVLQNVFEYHSFPCLKVLKITTESYVTKKGIDLFMNEGNALEKIEILECKSVTKENVEEWREIAKNKNWNVSIALLNLLGLPC